MQHLTWNSIDTSSMAGGHGSWLNHGSAHLSMPTLEVKSATRNLQTIVDNPNDPTCVNHGTACAIARVVVILRNHNHCGVAIVLFLPTCQHDDLQRHVKPDLAMCISPK